MRNNIILGFSFLSVFCSTFHLLCLARPPLHHLPRQPGNRPPSTQELYSKQRHWQKTKQITDNKKSTVNIPMEKIERKKGCFLPQIPVPAWQDEYLTAARPLLLSLTLSFIPSAFCLMPSPAGSVFHRWIVIEVVDAVYDCHFALFWYCHEIVLRQHSVGPAASQYWPK